MDGSIEQPSLLEGQEATVHCVQCCIKATKHHFTDALNNIGVPFLQALILLLVLTMSFLTLFNYRRSKFTGAQYLLALHNILFIICQHLSPNQNTNWLRNICTPENILTFFNGTDASYTSTHLRMSIPVIQDPRRNRKVLGNCHFYT